MTSAAGSKILIVDDNPALADNLSEILEEAGYKTAIAGSCAEALARSAGFTVGLVDVRLPDGDGTMLARQLKERVPDAEVILLTGFATLESAMAAVRRWRRSWPRWAPWRRWEPRWRVCLSPRPSRPGCASRPSSPMSPRWPGLSSTTA